MAGISTRSRPAPSPPPPPPAADPTSFISNGDFSMFGLDESPQEMSTKRDEGMALTRHIRASSDPISRGGAFTGDSNGLEFEPNPFEQSFSGPRPSSGPTEHSFDHTKARGPTVNATAGPSSGLPVRRARSTSPVPTNPRTNSGGLHKLPPLSLIESPGVVSELQGFGWASDSLRTGPLSPSVLSGPSPSVPTSIFDPSMMRTGLTPLVGGSGVSFPPPSPATAALFAMMTNNTPGTSDVAIAAGMGGGGSRPHEGVNEGNHFEASFARATDGKGGIISSARSQIDPRGQQQQHQMHAQQHQLAHQQHQQQLCDFTPQHVQGPPAPLGVLQRPASQQPPPRSIIPQSMHPLQLANNPYMQSGYPPMTQQQQQQQHQLMQQQRHHPQQQHQHQQSHQQQAYGNQNPLYLLSQAQDLSTHNDDAVVAAAALSNLSGPGFPAAVDETSTLNGSASVLAPKPESAKGSPAGSGKGKKVTAGGNKRKKGDEDKKAPPAKKGKKGKAADKEDEVDDFEDPGEEGSMSPQAHNPNETEEEKRKNFLERNRQAALKCRQRKKAWLANLQSKVEFLTADNDTLQSTVTNLKDEISSLRAILSAHSNCPISSANGGNDRRASQNGMMMQQQQQQPQFGQRF